MIKRITFLILVVIALFFAGPGFSQDLNDRAVTDRYLSAYKAYQDALQNNKPNADVEKLLADFIQAKADFEKAFPRNLSTTQQSGSQGSPGLYR